MNHVTIALEPGQVDVSSQKRTYTVLEIQDILSISRPTAYALIRKNYFRSIRVGGQIRVSKRASMNGWTVETGVMQMNNITPSSKKKTSISVREMRQILGLNKVESYWLVHQNRFRTIVAAGRMRIMLDSFEEWYAGQFHYKKVNGEAPGSKWEKTTMSIREAAALLGLQEATLYDLLKKKPFQTIQVDNRTRIDRTSFWAWYESQDFYRTVADQQADRLKFGETLTMPEVARLLGTHRNNVYYLVQKGCFETIQTSRTKLICKDSFERWYKGQSKYRIVSAANGGDEDGIHC